MLVAPETRHVLLYEPMSLCSFFAQSCPHYPILPTSTLSLAIMDELTERLQGLSPELYSLIYEFTFTSES